MPLSSAVLITRNAGCRLDHTGMRAYLTLDDLGRMIEDHVDFAVREAEDVTPSIFRQIIRKRALHG